MPKNFKYTSVVPSDIWKSRMDEMTIKSENYLNLGNMKFKLKTNYE